MGRVQECKALIERNGCEYYRRAKALAVRAWVWVWVCCVIIHCGSPPGVCCAHRCMLFHRCVLFTVVRAQESMPQVWDIEDLVDAGERSTACSYFVSRELLATARIVFCPYNYLVDPCVRAAMDVNLKSSVRGSGASVEVPSSGLHPHCTLLLPRGVVCRWLSCGR